MKLTILAALLCLLVSAPAAAGGCVFASDYETLDWWVGYNDLGYRLARCPLDDSSVFQINWPGSGWRNPQSIASYHTMADRHALYLTLLPRNKRPEIYTDGDVFVWDEWSTPNGDFRLVVFRSGGLRQFQVLGPSGYAQPTDGSYYNPDGANRLRFWWEQIPKGKRP